MSISFTMTAGEVVTRALKELRILSPGEDASAEEMADGIETLNLMFKSWGLDGVTCWTDIDGTATITGADPDVVLSPRPLFVTEARAVISSTNERPLSEWENAEYARLPNKAAAGTPTIYSLRYTPSDVTMRVWPVPSSNMTVKYGYARVIEDVSATTDTLDVSQEALETVIFCLAERLIGMFGGDSVNPTAAARVTAKAQALYLKLSDASRPEAYMMGAA